MRCRDDHRVPSVRLKHSVGMLLVHAKRETPHLRHNIEVLRGKSPNFFANSCCTLVTLGILHDLSLTASQAECLDDRDITPDEPVLPGRVVFLLRNYFL